jgi:hypothetical protein
MKSYRLKRHAWSPFYNFPEYVFSNPVTNLDNHYQFVWISEVLLCVKKYLSYWWDNLENNVLIMVL